MESRSLYLAHRALEKRAEEDPKYLAPTLRKLYSEYEEIGDSARRATSWLCQVDHQVLSYDNYHRNMNVETSTIGRARRYILKNYQTNPNLYQYLHEVYTAEFTPSSYVLELMEK